MTLEWEGVGKGSVEMIGEDLEVRESAERRFGEKKSKGS